MKLVTFIIVVGLLIAGWLNRDALRDRLAKHTTTEETEESSETPAADPNRPAPTPHPAAEAQAQAKAIYPGLALANSPLNQKFVALYRETQSSDPALLSRADWPLVLAEKAIVSLGGAPLARPAAAAQAKKYKPVVVYTTSHCPYCKQAKQYLMKRGVPFREVDIERSSAGKEEYRKLGGDGVPLIMIGDTKLQGFSETSLDRHL